jgi:hypothetical protein
MSASVALVGRVGTVGASPHCIMAQSAIDDRPEAVVPSVPVSVEPGAAPKKAGKARIVFPLLVAVAVLGGAATYLHGLGKEATDDAQVEGHIASVAPRVSGQVKRVLVKDNQEFSSSSTTGTSGLGWPRPRPIWPPPKRRSTRRRRRWR